MKLPRNARILRGQLDAAPYASVFFLLLNFIVMASLVYTPGVQVPLNLPVADGLPGTDRPTVAVAVESNGQLYFQNQRVTETEFTNRLSQFARKSSEMPTLVVQADKDVRLETSIRLRMLARAVGVQQMVEATLPRPFSSQTSP